MFMMLIAPSMAATLDVSSSGTYTTIQAAIDASSSGDVISVASGTYTGCIDLKGKDLTITGAGSSASKVVVSSCSSGAIIISSGEVATISGLFIRNSSGTGIVVDNSSIVDFSDIAVESSGGTSSSGALFKGGGMSVSGNSYVEVADSLFENNTADYGAAIFVDGASLDLSAVEFNTNDSVYGGGGIRGEYSAEIALDSCTFTANGTSVSSGKGGAISLYDEVVLTDNGSTFTDNFSATYGGAIVAESSSELTLNASIFDGNYVDRTFLSPISGGAIFGDDMETFDIDSAEFTNNVAYLYGGAIHCNGMNTGQTMTVSNTLFSNNETESKRGGAIEATSGTSLTISNSVFDQNTSAEAGAAVSFYGVYLDQDLIITDSTFTDNVTTSTSDAHGGAIFGYAFGASLSLDISDSVFEDNQASLSGGAVYTSGIQEVSISSTSFENNEASLISTTSLGSYNGGALNFYDADTVTLSALNICGNIADDGGGIYLEDVADLSLKNTLLIENTANARGGNFFAYDSSGEIVNNNLLGGSAYLGGGMYLASGSAMDVINNVVAYSAAGSGAGADSFSASASSFTYNAWYSNTSSDLTSSLSFSTTSSGNTTDDPDFSSYSADGNCSNDDFILDSTSALIDAGDPSILDPDGSDSDIGAYGGPDSPMVDGDGDGYYGDDDCDDDDSDVNPGATEVCDDVDNDCDGSIDNDPSDGTTWYDDGDGDGYGDTDSGAVYCSAPSGAVTVSGDCDDSDYDINPDAEEVCDGVDNDCDGSVDSGTTSGASTWYSDVDGDGFGSTFDTKVACEAPSGYVSNVSDCDDSDASIYPGADEYCDGDDNDCDGDTDEDDAVDGTTWYADLDGDGYGVSTFTKTACTMPSSYAATDDDCDDGDSAIYPGASEYCDGDDNDCDGDTDEDDAVDASTFYADSDGDGFGDKDVSTSACTMPSDYVSDDTDCDDDNASNNPDADEYCDGDDNDCDGDTDEDDAVDVSTFYADSDGDGYGDPDVSTSACAAPSGYVSDETDCDDSDAAFNPGADEVCDDQDNNCDGETDEGAVDALVFYSDSDGDGYGDAGVTVSACELPSGYSSDSTDCDDSSASSYPGADEVCDDQDNNCNELIDEDAIDATAWYTDADGDGYGDPTAVVYECDQPSATVSDNTDCDDTNGETSPGAEDIPYDGVDNDCQDGDLTDVDGDGYDGGPTGLDCDDDNADVNPGAVETEGDGVDQDCDGADGAVSDVNSDSKDEDGGGCSTTGSRSRTVGGWLMLSILGVTMTRRRRRTPAQNLAV